jgi:hypothetical protein
MVADLRAAARHLADALEILEKWSPELGPLLEDKF